MRAMPAILAVLLSYAVLSPALAERFHRMSDEEKAQCAAVGGRIANMGFGGGQGCVHPMPDAGKPCSDGSECQGGSCELAKGAGPFAEGAPIVGECVKDDNPYGCFRTVEKGKFGNDLCFD